jgi:hypothetical protein
MAAKESKEHKGYQLLAIATLSNAPESIPWCRFFFAIYALQ